MTHPDVEFDILVCDRFNIEANCWDGGDRLAQLEFVQDCCEKGKHVNGCLYQEAKKQQEVKKVGIILLVFPAASSPSISILISLLPKILDSIFPIAVVLVGT